MSPNNLKILFTVGKVFAPLYSLVMRLRAALYAKNIFSSVHLSIPVISIGNLTMGGTGKTPVVMYVSRLLGKEYKAAVISRGYGGTSDEPVTVVSDGQDVLLGAEVAGDEPVLLAKSLPGVPVITGAKRVLTGRYIVAGRRANLIVMDDGFQHLALKRDLNLVLFAGDELLGNGFVFPGGVLREPISALGRADAFVVTGVTDQNKNLVDRFRQKLYRQFATIPLFEIRYQVTKFISRNSTSKHVSVSDLQKKKLFAFCGIAKPDSFFSMLRGEGVQLGGTKKFADHHKFSKEDLECLCEDAHLAGCEGLVATEKDFVKMNDLPIVMPIWIAQLDLIVSDDFDQFILAKVRAVSA